MRSDIAQGDGMYKSTRRRRDLDAHRPRATRSRSARILVDPRDAGPRLRRRARPSVRPERRARRLPLARRRRDLAEGARARTPTPARSTSPSSPAIRSVIYAALWQTRRPPWNVYPPSNGPGSGLYKSTDGGAHLDADHRARLSGAARPHRPRRRAQPARSASTRWSTPTERRPVPLGRRRRDWTHDQRRRAHLAARLVLRRHHRRAAATPTSSTRCNTIVLPLERRRQDLRAAQGRARRRRLPRAVDRSRASRAADPRRRPGRGRVARTAARPGAPGTTSRPAQIYHVDHRQPLPVLGLRRAAGFRRGRGVPSRTTTHRRHQHDAVPRGHGRRRERQRSRPIPNDPDIVYGGRVEKLDLRTEQTQSVDPTLAYPDDLPRDLDAAARLLAARSARALLRATSGCSAPRTAASTGRAISPDLTREDPGVPPNLDPPTAARQARRRPAPRRHLRDRALAPGRSRPLGRHRRRPGLAHARRRRALAQRHARRRSTPWSKVGIIDASHFDAETAYAAIDRHRLDDFKPYIYRTHDGGKTWTAGRRRHPRRQLRQRRARGPGAPRPALRRHREGRLRLLRRRRPLAAAAAQPAGDLGARHRRARRRPRDRHARPRLLDPGRRDAAAPGRRRATRRAAPGSSRPPPPCACARPGSPARRCRRTSRWRRIRRPARTSTTSLDGAAEGPGRARDPRRSRANSCASTAATTGCPPPISRRSAIAPEWATPPSPPARRAGHAPLRLAAPLSGARGARPSGNPYADGVWAPPGPLHRRAERRDERQRPSR